MKLVMINTLIFHDLPFIGPYPHFPEEDDECDE